MKEQVKWMVRGALTALIVIGIVWWKFVEQPHSVLVRPGSTSDASATSTHTAQGQKNTHADLPVPRYVPVPQYATVPSHNETISAEDQDAGSQVVVRDVQVFRPTWIAVRDIHGSVLGARWIATSQNEVSVNLLRATQAGATYQVVLYADNGDKQFSARQDALVVSVDEAPVSVTFSAR